MGRRANGAGIVRALDALGAITGNIGIPGGAVMFEARRRRPFDLSFIKGNAPRFITEPLLGKEILAAQDPPIRAVWVTAGNPVAMLPDSATTAEALRTRDLVVVVDPFLTDTAACAHVVLPTTTLLEDDDVLGSYGHHYVGVSTPVVPRPENVRSDLEIVQALAARVGLADVVAGRARSTAGCSRRRPVARTSSSTHLPSSCRPRRIRSTCCRCRRTRRRPRNG